MPLKIFISYVREDNEIADTLRNSLKRCFGDEKIEVFKDSVSLEKGVELLDALRKSVTGVDVLVVISTGVLRPSHNWAGFELGVFEATHSGAHPAGAHPLWGRVFILCQPQTVPAVAAGRLYIPLDVDTVGAVTAHDPMMAWFSQLYQQIEGDTLDNDRAAEGRITRQVTQLKQKIVAEYKKRPRAVWKPQKQLIVRFDPQNQAGATILFQGNAGAVFGIPERQDGAAMSWAEFTKELGAHPRAKNWLGSLQSLMDTAEVSNGLESDHGTFIRSHDGQQLFRPVVTTCTVYRDNSIEASIYLILVRSRPDVGDPVTTRLLKALKLVCRFRFLFLEKQSEFNPVNVVQMPLANVPAFASRILAELELLDSDMISAELHLPGAWSEYLNDGQIRAMAEIWYPLRVSLGELCAEAATTAPAAMRELRQGITQRLEDVRRTQQPNNAVVLRALAEHLSGYAAAEAPEVLVRAGGGAGVREETR